MTIDGQLHPPLLTDQDRWRRVIFDFNTLATFQRMDDTFVRYGSSISDADKTLTFTKPADKSWKANFSFTRLTPEQLLLQGAMDGHKIQMQLKLQDRNKFLLVNRGFHWINEVPFNR
jgi:hypothetical protein